MGLLANDGIRQDGQQIESKQELASTYIGGRPGQNRSNAGGEQQTLMNQPAGRKIPGADLYSGD